MSFDSFPIVYWLIGFALFFLMAASTLKKSWSPSLMLLLGGIGLIMMRLPVVVFNYELNPDESQVIAHALTLRQNPLFWLSVDGTTIGPLDIYLINLVAAFSKDITYSTLHVLAIGCSLASLLFFYSSIRNFFNTSTAQLSILPIVLFLALTQETDFIHYSSEQVPLVMLTLALWLASILYKSDRTDRWLVFVTGFVLGMIPFTKLQASLQAVFLGVGILGLLLLRRQKSNIPFFILGGLGFPFLVFLYLAAFGLVTNFWEFYIKGNLVYAGGGNTKNIFLQFIDLVSISPDFLKYIASIAVLAVIGVLSFKGKIDKWLLTFSGVWLLVSIYAVTKTGNPFVHYLNLLIYPLALLGSVFIANISKPSLQNIAIFSPLIIWLSFFVPKAVKRQPFNVYISNTTHNLPQSDVSKKILEFVRPNDMLVVWGWACRYHVETQLGQGTAENHTERCIYEHPMRPNYRNRYIADMRRNRPAIFVDAIGKNSLWLQDISSQGHQNFPELKAFIDTNYSLVDTLDDVRIYVLKERNIRN